MPVQSINTLKQLLHVPIVYQYIVGNCQAFLPGRLRVHAAHLEPRCDPGATAEALAGELVMLAEWLGLDDLKLDRRGNLAGPLKQALALAR